MNWIPFWFLFKRECHRFQKVLVQTVVTPLVNSSLYLLIFGVSLGSQMKADEMNYLAFLIPGLMMMGVMNNSFQNSSSSVVSSKFTGDLEDLAVVPLSVGQIVWAMSLASVIRGVAVAIITLLAGEIFYFFKYDNIFWIQHPFWALYFLFMGGMVFGLLGLIAAFWARSFDQLSAISAFIILPLTYLGGVFMSIQHLHPFWQMVAQLNPLFYFINGLRFSALGIADVSVYHSSLVVFIAFLVIYFLTTQLMKKVSFSRW